MGRLLLLAILCLPEFEAGLYFSSSTCSARRSRNRMPLVW